jgi:hypothetical protein
LRTEFSLLGISIAFSIEYVKDHYNNMDKRRGGSIYAKQMGTPVSKDRDNASRNSSGWRNAAIQWAITTGSQRHH